MAINFNGKEITISDGDCIVFMGTQRELSRLVTDSKRIAEAIKLDIEFNHINEFNDSVDFEQYKKFSEKYGN